MDVAINVQLSRVHHEFRQFDFRLKPIFAIFPIASKILLFLKVVKGDPKNNHLASFIKVKSKSPIHTCGRVFRYLEY